MISRAYGGPLFALVLVSTGCTIQNGDGSISKTDGGKVGPNITPILSGPQIKYVPDGCDYAVTSETVDTAVVGGKTAATQPPDHVHAGLQGEAATSFTVNWRSSEQEADQSEVIYGTDVDAVTGADDATGAVKKQTGHSLLMKSILDTEGTRVHEAHLCGLQPATKYYYKAGNKGAWSKVFSVTTAPETGASTPITIAVTGDCRNDGSVWASTQKAISAAAPQVQLFSGDAVILGSAQTEWAKFFESTVDGIPVSDYLARTPIVMANGNHDSLAVNYLTQFSAPQDVTEGEVGEGKEWYSFDYGNVHVISLNDSTSSDSIISNEEKNWLRQDLAAVDRAKTPWIIAMNHQPTYTCKSTHSPDTTVQAAWQPLFDEYKVDIVFNGHVHNYERSKPIRGLNGTAGIVVPSGANGVPQNGNGTIYVVAAGAGADLYPASSDCAQTYKAESTRNYVILNVEGMTLNYKAYRLDGSTLDEFTYTKN